MAAASKNFALHGAHTAGIFADMTVDGPEIGTLVCIVDRAKNLPNRKTIGKQDPYCAARLGKEAKKTATDIRGGQTPKWDQELRFTVHDSADYYQFKVSVFTDDKKTDLIGESWIDLKPIIIPGGGQNDMWQTLTCRGKYAGEIRLEITYYDARPKPDKSSASSSSSSKMKPPSPVQQEVAPVKRKDPMKRRPLPTDPVTGETTAVIPTEASSRGHAKQHSHPEYSTGSSTRGGGPRELRPTKKDSYENARRSEEREISQKIPVSQYDQSDPRGEYAYASDREEPRQHRSHGVHPPPPPPAHRARHSQEALRRSSQDVSAQKAIPPSSMRYEALKNEPHRKASPSYPGRPKFRGHEHSSSANAAPPTQKAITYNPPIRRDSYDAYDPHHRSMQPTVEDYPESEAGSFGGNYRHTNSRMHQEEAGYDNGAVPVPNHMSRSPGGSHGYMGQSPGRMQNDYREPRGYNNSVSPMASRDYTDSPAQMPYHSHGNQSQRHNPRDDHETTYIQSSSSYALHNLPPSLAPGVDQHMVQEASHRMYDDRRHDGRYSNSQSMAISTRDRQRSEPPMYDSVSGASPQAYSIQKYDRRRSDMHYSDVSDHQMPRHRNPSPNPPPNPSHTIRRKSVSPAPPPSDTRRLSDIPFGPDSYDTYNPSASRGGTPGLDPEPPSKIMTYDGKEIDPSDHLPIESWAPEPEQKPAPAATETRSRPALTGAQPMPQGGRRQLRVRAQTASTPSDSYNYQEDSRTSPGPPPTARGRLQKKSNRPSTSGHSPSGSNPLGPISTDNYQDRQGQYAQGRAPRAGAWEYANENYAPQYHGGAHGPPIPAKVPLIMSGANGGADMNLIEEMQKIDIGVGRSRRRGGY
ncbi:Ingression protein fic1 [Cladobotryum mycophilum]|uniref:Ingression protein fic1 n=1 Tax=Cladobotryum mycophilum TaxID=491253 RepID=A0ABR0S4S6_9HYPO